MNCEIEQIKKDELLKVIKEYAYFSSKRKRLELYKPILLVHIMKEIAAKNEYTVAEQEFAAKNTFEFKNLLAQIKELSITESTCSWRLNKLISNIEEMRDFVSSNKKTDENIFNVG